MLLGQRRICISHIVVYNILTNRIRALKSTEGEITITYVYAQLCSM